MSTTGVAPASAGARIVDVDPATLRRWMDDGIGVLVDVREDFEHGEERIDGAMPMPLSRFDATALRERSGQQRIVFQCRSGRRSADAAARYAAVTGDEAAYHLAGGIEAWKDEGRATVRPAGGARLPIMRQVQVVAGSLVLLGVVLGATVSAWFHALSGFVGAGLVFAGLSGWCGMAMLLARMPWNHVADRSCGRSEQRPS